MSSVSIDGEMFLCASRVLPKPKQKGNGQTYFCSLFANKFLGFYSNDMDTNKVCTLFFRDAKFLLEAVGITKRKKENQRVVFFLVLPE